MGGIQVDKSLKNFIVIITALLSTMLLRGAAVGVRSAGTATTLLSFASMQLTSSFATSSGTNAVTQPLTHVEECSEWTEWMDDEDGGTLDPSSIGEFEIIDILRNTYVFCNETIDIECALADDTDTPYNETGQVSVTCDLQQGFMCFHSQQSGDCSNYAIRVLCPAPCPSTQGNAVTTVSSTPVQLSADYSSSPEVTMMPTTQSTACAEDENTDCSAETFTCPREFRLECNVTISSDTDLGMCIQHNITKASTEELWTTLNKTIPVCCFSANFTWILRSRRRRDTTGSMAIMVSELLVDDSTTVDAQTVLEVFISSVNQSNVFKSYGISYEPGTASVIEPGREPETSKPEKDSVKIVIVVCSIIAVLIVVTAVVLCFVCIFRRFGRKGKYKQTPVTDDQTTETPGERAIPMTE